MVVRIGRFINPKQYNPGIQAGNIQEQHPDFDITFEGDTLIVKGWSKPTARSRVYRYKLVYKHNQRPIISITDPEMELHDEHKKLPHVYFKDQLCLYYPHFNEFSAGRLISETIIPWIALWIYFYEIWLTTGKWLGGGMPH